MISFHRFTGVIVGIVTETVLTIDTSTIRTKAKKLDDNSCFKGTNVILPALHSSVVTLAILL